MLKKRLIFTVLLEHKKFVLSRNFRLQSFGDLKWLMERYNFSQIAFALDEIIIVDVNRNNRKADVFCEHIKSINKTCFIPISAGGGIQSFNDAKKILNSGADKVVLNTILYKNPDVVYEIAEFYGNQCIVASVDTKKNIDQHNVYISNGSYKIEYNLDEWIKIISKLPIGEIYLNSIDNDGTGNGYNFEILNFVPNNINMPIILAGGAGNYFHFAEGLKNTKVDAVATANLFNFIGDGLINARKKLIEENFNLVVWHELNEKFIS